MEPFYQASAEMTEQTFSLAPFRNMNFPAHLHNSFELLFITNGAVEVTVNGVSSRAGAGDVVVVPPNDIHAYATPGAAEGFLMLFAGPFLGDLQRLFGRFSLENHGFRLPDSGIGEFFRQYSEASGSPYRPFLCKGYVSLLFYRILSRCRMTEKKEDTGFDLLRKLLAFTQREYDRGINLNETARSLGLSRSYVSRFFRAAIGYGFSEYVNRLRIEKSKGLLAAGRLSILDVAVECGFDGQRSFDRVFKKYAGMTPSAFRRQAGNA